MLAKGYLSSKRCDIGPAGFPSRSPDCCQKGGFPLRPLHPVAEDGTGLPLSTHFNPRQIVHCTQSRSFPLQPTLISSLFCSNGFRADDRILAGIPTHPFTLIRRHHSRQATLHPASTKCRFSYYSKVIASTDMWVMPACRCGLPPYP